MPKSARSKTGIGGGDFVKAIIGIKNTGKPKLAHDLMSRLGKKDNLRH